jgi:cyclic pyranopterin phosphate synthase
MPTGTERAFSEREAVSACEVQAWLAERGDLVVEPGESTAAARRSRLRWRSAVLPIGWITPVSRPFCARCSRVRLDAHGHLRRCLIDPSSLDLTELVRHPRSEARARLTAFLSAKLRPSLMHNHLPMSSLGG